MMGTKRKMTNISSTLYNYTKVVAEGRNSSVSNLSPFYYYDKVLFLSPSSSHDSGVGGAADRPCSSSICFLLSLALLMVVLNRRQ